MANLNKYTDQELISLLQNGNRAAYAALYNRYKLVLQSHAYKKLGNFEEVRDILQDVFAGLWEKREELPNMDNLSGYLYTAVRNRIFNLMAHKAVARKYVESLQNYLDNNRYASDQKMVESEIKEEIEKEISALPPKMREIFILSRRSALSHREIAEQLSLSEQTVSKQVSNALKILRKKLALFLALSLFLALLWIG